MNIIVAGLSHKTASVEIRERFSFSSHNLTAPLQEIVNCPSIGMKLSFFLPAIAWKLSATALTREKLFRKSPHF
jgi:hypothetical protein